ncbi:MAG TPA: NTP transferase domain-containing protein [Candidatus Cloacimonadota bacterium]|nr:NTP transferase domain-containing protein [Candidatus Cloacimonadota bacterium]
MTAVAAIILAAGKGTRMKSDRAKVVFELAGKTLIERVVATTNQLPCEKICVVVGHQKDTVIKALEDFPNLVFAMQDKQLGTGHAVLMAEPYFKDYKGDILVLAGDVPLLKSETLKKLTETHQQTKAACTVLTAQLEDAGKYGRILRNEEGRVIDIVEFKDATPEQLQIKEFNTGIWCFQAEPLFSALHQITNHNAQQEYYLTDVLSVLVKQGMKVESVLLDDLQQASGINSQQELAELEDAFLAEVKERWLNNGVTIHNPSSVYIGEDVVIEPDVIIEANSILKGKTFLEKGCYIGPNCYLENATIGTEAILRGYNVIIEANVHAGEIIDWGEKILEDTMFQK